jgi:5-methylcytosine-specific restriction endonuclease McrA
MRTPNVECIICGKPMYRRPFEIKKARYFACKKHREVAKRLFKPTDKQLEALELGREKGTNHLQGIPKSEESKIKRSKSIKEWCKNNKDKVLVRGKKTRGELHYNWKGGKSNLNQDIRSLDEMRKWQKTVKKRDKKCLHCGSTKELESHHIISVNEMLDKYNITNRDEARRCKEFWNIQNGITLCRKCHYKLEGRTYAKNR